MTPISPTQISPTDARALIARGALLVDVREADEHARTRLPGARNMPLSRLVPIDPGTAPAIIYHCRSGARTAAHARRLDAASPCPAYVLEGGLEGWRKAGLPVIKEAGQPIELMRQVQIAAGLLILTGLILGLTVAPGFIALSAFVGCGLTFAGVTGWCGMARLLGLMPWNRRARA